MSGPTILLPTSSLPRALGSRASSTPLQSLVQRRRSRASRERLLTTGSRPGCLLYAPRDVLTQPLWGTLDSDAKELRELHLTRSFAVAQELGARRIAVLSGADPEQPRTLQHAALIENLKSAAEKAERASLVLCLENLSRRSLPGMLLEHVAEAYAAVTCSLES